MAQLVDQPVDQPEDDIDSKLENVDYVRFTYADIHGIARGKTVPARHAKQFIKKGIGAYAGAMAVGPRSQDTTMQRVVDMGHGNMSMKASLDTYHPVPWAGGGGIECKGGFKVGEVFCDAYWETENTPMDAAPRVVALKQLKRLEELGYSFYSAFEWEFRIIDRQTGKLLQQGTDAYCHLSFSQMEHVLFDIEHKLHTAGVDVETLEAEYGSCMYEFAVKPLTGIGAADTSFLLKSGMKEICQQRGYDCVFMAKPILHESGNGAHFNHSLWDIKTGKGVLYDEGNPNNLSDVARHWIGGLVKNFRSIAALLAPTVHCYRRFHLPWAPHIADWGLDDRSVSLRVMNKGEKGTYFENRVPSGSCNPYLVMAATIAAGIDGIENKLEPPKSMEKEAEEFPHTLAEALTCLEENEAMVQSLGREFVDWFAKAKRDIEVELLKDSDVSREDLDGLEKEKEMYMKYC